MPNKASKAQINNRMMPRRDLCDFMDFVLYFLRDQGLEIRDQGLGAGDQGFFPVSACQPLFPIP
jgi:hypothetical protein